MQDRPFVLLGAAVLDGVRQMLDGVLAAWCADWGMAAQDAAVECQRAWEAAPAAFAWQEQGGAGALWLAWTAEFQEQLQRALFAPDRHYAPGGGQAVLAAEGAAAAWSALRGQLMAMAQPGGAAPQAADAPPPLRHWQQGSGSLLLTLRIGKHSATGLLDLPAVRHLAGQARLRGLLPPDAPLPPLPALDYRRALAGVPVRIPVVLGGASVGVGSLLALAPGDVLRLDRAADQPIGLDNAAGERWFDGCLGTIGASLGLEVVAPAASA